MPNVTITIDPHAGAIYAGPPSALGSELSGVTIGSDFYTLSPGGRFLQSPTGPTFALGQQGVTILNYSEYGEYQLSTPIQQGTINSFTANAPQRAIGGSLNVVLPTGEVANLSLDFAVLTPAGYRQLTYIDANGEVRTADNIRSNLPLSEALAQVNATEGHFSTSDEVILSGLTGHLYANEKQLIEDVYNSHIMADEGYNDTFSGAAAWLVDHADMSQLQAFSQYFIR